MKINNEKKSQLWTQSGPPFAPNFGRDLVPIAL